MSKPFWVIFKGGSNGNQGGIRYFGIGKQAGIRYSRGGMQGQVDATFDTAEEAKEYAKIRRSRLSAEDKSYYGMGFSVVKADKSAIQ